MNEFNYKKLIVWQQSKELIKKIYSFTGLLPKEEQYNLIAHCRKTSLSVASNVAEGAARTTDVDRKRFYVIARASLMELDTQIEIASEIYEITDYCDSEVNPLVLSIFRMLSKMIRNLER